MLFPVALLASLISLQQTPAAPSASVAPASAPSTAQAPAPADGRTVVARQAEPAQVCRTEPVTGSRFGRRVCRNSVETADERRDSQEMLRRMQGSRMPDGQ